MQNNKVTAQEGTCYVTNNKQNTRNPIELLQLVKQIKIANNIASTPSDVTQNHTDKPVSETINIVARR